MISPNPSYYPPSPFPRLDAPSSASDNSKIYPNADAQKATSATPQKPGSTFPRPSNDSLVNTSNPAGKPPTSNQPDMETKIIAGWNQGLKDNKAHKDMTGLMGIGCLLMNFVPGLKMRWGTTIKMAVANMGLMVLIHQGLGMVKGYQEKKSL